MEFALRRKKEELKERVSIQSEFASTVVILANPDLSPRYLTEKLADIRDKGYDIGHRLRGTPFGPYSKELGGFLGRLEMGGYTRGSFVNASSLNEHGVDLFERFILKRYIERPEVTQRLVDDAGLDLMPIFRKHLEEYLKLINPEIS